MIVLPFSSVTLVTLYGQTRILFTMGRDGLLPATFAKVNPRTMTPVRNTVIVAFAVVATVLGALLTLRRAMPEGSGLTVYVVTAAVATLVVFGVLRLVAARLVWDGVFAVSDGLLSLSEGDYGGDAAADIGHDSAILARLQAGSGSFARVNGSWKDF